MVWPDGAPATAEIATGEVTVEPAAGEQIVTAPAVGVHVPPPPPPVPLDVPTVMVSEACSEAPVLSQATITILYEPFANETEVESVLE